MNRIAFVLCAISLYVLLAAVGIVLAQPPSNADVQREIDRLERQVHELAIDQRAHEADSSRWFTRVAVLERQVAIDAVRLDRIEQFGFMALGAVALNILATLSGWRPLQKHRP